MTEKNPQKQGRILERGGERIFLAGQNIYPCLAPTNQFISSNNRVVLTNNRVILVNNRVSHINNRVTSENNHFTCEFWPIKS